MGGFRGSDDRLDREIAEIERTVRLRLRRAAADLRSLDGELRELRRERVRRRAAVPGIAVDRGSAPVEA